MRKLTFCSILFCVFLIIPSYSKDISRDKKPGMTFMDVLTLKRVSGRDISNNKQLFIYEISTLDWKDNKRYSDLYLTSTSGLPAKQMTYTKKKNERSPKWHPDSSFFAFLADRTGKNQIYFMRPDGGEAWQITETEEGVISYNWNKDGSFLAYLTGKDKEKQLWIRPGIEGQATKLTKHQTPVESWFWGPEGKKIYFIAPDTYDEIEKKRIKKGFDVKIINSIPIARHLWFFDLEDKEEKRLTSGEDYSVQYAAISDDGEYIAFIGASTDRYASRSDSEVYLLEVKSNKINRLTHNSVYEGFLSFSPDSLWLAYSAPDEFTYMRRGKIYLNPLKGGKTLKLPENFDFDAGISFWSEKGDMIFFNTLEGTTYNLYAVSVAEGSGAMKVTDEKARLFASKDKDTGFIIINYSDPHHPSDLYLATMKTLSSKDRWIRLTEANTHVKNFALAEYENISWKSTDGETIEGILVYPIGYEKGKKYPLIVQIHGGPASAYTHSFSGSYGTYTNVFAAHGYALFQPNYRGSSGYGEKFRMVISGNYFRQAFDDIMSGVDYLIERGIADSDKLGMMGWSAGGHWSNWTLVSTDRFRAISTGAGAVNWISLYAQTDVQDTREFYFKGKPYDNWEHYVEVSPLKYIKNAKTPTLIHFGEKDRRIPQPQGEELHMALKKLDVPTEFIVYPNMPHGLRNPRYQLVKMESEFAWFEKWIKGKEGWINWNALLNTLEGEKEKDNEDRK
ncbi:MAG: prolyl oligopeptidase family serine peptidase [Candidatus Aminicenantaceae bacterium]